EKVGLLIYLHGQVHDAAVQRASARRMLADPGEMRSDDAAINAANLARYLYSKCKVGKVAVAAPNDQLANFRDDTRLWTDFDFRQFIRRVLVRAGDNRTLIDLTRVAV